jgi:hypothetical protein
VVFGREALADGLARNKVPLVLVTGDSGIGKSTVLKLASTPRIGWLAPEPITVSHSSGALYNGFLHQLAAALTALAEGGLGIPPLAERLVATGQRLASTPGSVLARVALAELVAAARGKVGDDLGKAVTEYAKDIWPDTAETVAAKAVQSRDPLAAEILCAFAASARELAEGMSIALHVDQGQRLGAEDRRLLGDLAEQLPADVHLRIAFATDSLERTQAVKTMLADFTRTTEIEVPPLAKEAVEEWLASEGVEGSLAAALLRQTDGYPLLLEGAIKHLASGGDLIDLPRNQQLAVRTRASWQGLSTPSATVARRLSVLPDPLPEPDLRQLAEIPDVGTWATVLEELQHSRVFSTNVNGQPWFHHERREFVLKECLSETQRDEAASAAASLLWSKSFATTDFDSAGLFAQLVALSPSYQEQERHLTSAVELDGPALATAAALLELATGGEMASEAASLLSHALTFIDGIPDPAEALSHLAATGLVATASNEWATMVVAGWGPRTQAVILGRSALRLRRPAVPQLVEVAFHSVLHDDLGDFETARFGIGSPSIGELGRLAVGADARSGHIDRRDLGKNLLLRGSLIGEIPLYCAVSYGDASSRDDAKRTVSNAKVSTLIGEVAIKEAINHPHRPVPIQRFAAALARARGEHHVPDTNQPRPRAPEGMSDEAIAETRIRTAELLSELAGPTEQVAMELDQGYVLAWEAGDDFWDESVIHGAGFFQRRVPALRERSLYDQYQSLRLRQAIPLTAGQHLAHRSARYGKDVRRDPVAAEIAYRRGRAQIFNSAQPRLDIALSKDALHPLLSDSFETELADARRVGGLIGLDRPEVQGWQALWLLIVLDEPHPGWVAGARGMALYSEGPSPDDGDRVYLEFKRGEPREGGWTSKAAPGLFSEVFPGAGPAVGTATIDHIVTRYLRHHSRDIRLTWP